MALVLPMFKERYGQAILGGLIGFALSWLVFGRKGRPSRRRRTSPGRRRWSADGDARVTDRLLAAHPCRAGRGPAGRVRRHRRRRPCRGGPALPAHRLRRLAQRTVRDHVERPPGGDPLQGLGAAIRYGTSLSARVREIAILLVARAVDSPFEWWAHERVGRAVGLGDDELTALADGRFTSDDQVEQAAVELCIAVFLRRTLDDSAYRGLQDRLGVTAMVEVTVSWATTAPWPT